MRLSDPVGIRAEMARKGILPYQLQPYEDPERGHVDPFYEEEMKGLIVSFLRNLNRAIDEAVREGRVTDESWAEQSGGTMTAKTPFTARLGAAIGNWNDRASHHDTRLEASLRWRLIDRLAHWLYVRGER